tara:strand:+ start:128 stop:271 length:144 start_codon:yes stop_codon:yes gene_type:complete
VPENCKKELKTRSRKTEERFPSQKSVGCETPGKPEPKFNFAEIFNLA